MLNLNIITICNNSGYIRTTNPERSVYQIISMTTEHSILRVPLTHVHTSNYLGSINYFSRFLNFLFIWDYKVGNGLCYGYEIPSIHNAY